MEVLAGNHTLEAARQLGWDEIAATFVDADEERAKRILLADNRTNDLAGYEPEALAELPELSGTGYDEDDLDALLAELGRARPGDDEPPPWRRRSGPTTSRTAP
jgi:ParB-like chromosome segregation protein Spo0J